MTEDGVILACDFCGADWDMVKPMIEGHKGSILCLDCLSRAIDQAAAAERAFACTLCLVDREPPMKRWSGPRPTAGDDPAQVCWDCLQQADRTFARDADTDWQRRIPPDRTWR